MENDRAQVKYDAFLYYGSFYMCRLEIKYGDIWDVIHKGTKFAILERFHVRIEIEIEDFEQHFVMM